MHNRIPRAGFIGVIALVTAAYLGAALTYYRFFFEVVKGKTRQATFVKEGLNQIPAAAEMDRLFEDCRHQIFSRSGGGTTWNTTAFFGGRYELAMEVPVEILSPKSGQTTGAPTYSLREASEVSISPSGQVGASFIDHVEFGPKKWKQLYANKGDFNSIGITLNPTPVTNFQAYAKSARR